MDERPSRFSPDAHSSSASTGNGAGRAASQPPVPHYHPSSPPIPSRYPSGPSFLNSMGVSRSSSFSAGAGTTFSASSSLGAYSTGGRRRAFSPQRFESTFEEDEYYTPAGYREHSLDRERERELRGRLAFAGSTGLGSRSQSLIPSSQQNPSYPQNVPRRVSNSQHQPPSNQSPFVRDVTQILLDDPARLGEAVWGTAGSASRQPHSLSSSAQDYPSGTAGAAASWGDLGGFGFAPRGLHFDEPGGIDTLDSIGGGGSGTTSRRHSVSVVQPAARTLARGHYASSVQRQPLRTTGFDAAESTPTQSTPVMGSGLVLSDDDLAADLGSLNIGPPSLPPHGMNGGTSSSFGSGHRGLSISPRDDRDQYTFSSIPSQYHNGGSHSTFSVGSRQLHLSTSSLSSSTSGYQQSPISPPARSPVFPAPIQRASTHQPSQRDSQQAHPQPPPAPQQGPQHYLQHAPQQHHHSHSQQPLIHQPMAESQMGRGIPLSSLPPSYKLFIVEFKAGRTDLFYLPSSSQFSLPQNGDLVIVEGDRGKDLGKVVNQSITRREVEEWLAVEREREQQSHDEEPTSPASATPPTSGKKDLTPKLILGLASASDVSSVKSKEADEQKALSLCQQKVRAKKMPMEVVDAEYQWDRKKLTFYFVSDKRIDFRELVRELFRLYKTRIWMAALQAPSIPPTLSHAPQTKQP